MRPKMRHARLSRLLAVIAMLAMSVTAAPMTAAESFVDGNRLYRDDLYWAALLRYRQAAEAGMDSALLHYNTGIAHYQARQHLRARESLTRALDSPTLRASAQYNLGLNAARLGETAEALRWFRLARDQQQSEALSEYASLAISRLLAEERVSDPIVVREEQEERRRELTRLSIDGSIGFGTDDNVFRSPDTPYVDRSEPTEPTVTPTVASGAYMPIDLGLRYQVNPLTHEGFFAAYRLSANYYQDQELENANEFVHEALFGSEYRNNDENRQREVSSAFRVAQHDETWYDPDDGIIRNVNGIDIADRMNYLRYGPELRVKQGFGDIAFGLIVKGQLWDYEDVEEVAPYDHEYFLFRTYAQIRFEGEALLRVSASRYSRRFSDRPSFDLSGDQLVDADPVRYDYLDVMLTARQQILDSLWFGFAYTRTQREDRYRGYHDYGRDGYRIELHWDPHRRFSVDVGAEYDLYDFDRAFAFHDPDAERKSLEAGDATIDAEFRVTPNLSVVFEGRRRTVVSTDLRLQYERARYLLGVRWAL